MASITEEALVGEWFYLEEEEPFDHATPEFFILEAGKVRSSTQAGLHGSYFIAGAKAVLTFAPREHSKFVLTLHAAGEFFDHRTPSMEAAASYVMEAMKEPVTFYGSFVRRFADFVSSADVERRSR